LAIPHPNNRPDVCVTGSNTICNDYCPAGKRMAYSDGPMIISFGVATPAVGGGGGR
jgi:hypothetical protein